MEADGVVSKCLDTLTEQKTQQEQILLGLLKTFADLREELGDTSRAGDLESRTDLRTAHIDQLKMTIDGLERYRQQRRREVEALLPEVRQMCAEMREPLPAAVAGLGARVPVDTAFVDALRQCHERLHALKEERQAELRQLRASISMLHAQLRLPPAELEQFLLYVQTPEARCVDECRAECARLLDLKRKNGRRLVEVSLARIQELWDALGFGDEKRVLPEEVTRFLMAGDDNNAGAGSTTGSAGGHGDNDGGDDEDEDDDDDDGTVDRIFRVCEAEVDRLTALLNELRPVLQAIQERERLLRERDAFQETVRQDKNRFQNAGNMLREEKKRRLFEKRLPMLEKRLAAMLRKWAEEHHERVMHNGVDYLAHMEAEARAERERAAEHRRQRALERAGLDPDSAALRAYGTATLGKNRAYMEQTLSSTMKMVHANAPPPRTPAAAAATAANRLGRTLPLPSSAAGADAATFMDMGTTLGRNTRQAAAVVRAGAAAAGTAAATKRAGEPLLPPLPGTVQRTGQKRL